MFKNAEKWHRYLACGEIPFLEHFFQKAAILRPIEIMTWNQLSVTPYFLNFHVVKSAFWYLTPFWNNSILKNGLIWNIFFGTSEEMTLQYISYSTVQQSSSTYRNVKQRVRYFAQALRPEKGIFQSHFSPNNFVQFILYFHITPLSCEIMAAINGHHFQFIKSCKLPAYYLAGGVAF